jgi:SET domain-containing protein
MILSARNEFKKRDKILEYEGVRINQTEANKREEIYDNITDGMYLFALDEDTIIDATLSYTIARFINHASHNVVINAYAGTLPQP